MKIDKEFKDKFSTTLNNLSREEFLNIIENPTVDVSSLIKEVNLKNIYNHQRKHKKSSQSTDKSINERVF